MLTPERILDTSFGFRASRMLLSALELGVFTELGKGPRSAEQLCRVLGLNMSAAPQWLDSLVSLGFLERDGEHDGAIYLNSREASQFLDRNSDAYIGAQLERIGSRVYSRWDSLIRSLRTGEADPEWRDP